MSFDRLSLSTVPITPFFNDLRLPEATGFIWKRHERYYLITNWHVVSALDLFTNMHLLKGGSRPNKFRCHILFRVGEYWHEPIDVPVRDENDQPLWLIHPAQEMRAIDIVALALDYDRLKTKSHIAPGERTSAGEDSHHDRHGGFHSRIPIRLKTARIPRLETRQHRVRTGFGTSLHRVLLGGYRLTSRHVGLAGHITQLVKPHP